MLLLVGEWEDEKGNQDQCACFSASFRNCLQVRRSAEGGGAVGAKGAVMLTTTDAVMHTH